VEGSYAQKYADDNGIKFEILKNPNITEPVTGDVNNDGIVSAADFVKLVQHILYPEKQINSKTSDMNGDGKIDSADATELKKLFLG
ncbi:MAG: dockerin type I repeat-containing protein, partial [Oscillospiraceae bacterium]